MRRIIFIAAILAASAAHAQSNTRAAICDPNFNNCATVMNSAPAGTEYAQLVRLVGGSAGDGAIQDGANSAIEATVRDYTNSNPLACTLTDTNGDYVAAGGGTQYAEDTATGAGDLLNMCGVVRQDTAASLVGANNERTQMSVGATGLLWVDGSAVTQPVSAASLPLPSGASTAAKQPALGTAGTASADVITVQGIASMTALTVSDGAGALNVIVDSGSLTCSGPLTDAQLRAVAVPVSGTVTVTDGAGALNTIIDSGAVTCSQATAANLKAEVVGTLTNNGAASGAANVGTLPGVATAAVPTYTEGRHVALSTDLSGNLRVGDGTGALNTIVDSGSLTCSISQTGDANAVDVLTMPTVTVTDGAGAMNVIVDSSATVTVTDGAGAINVIIDSSAALTADGTIQDGVTPSIEVSVRDYTNSNPLAVALTDANGDLYSAGGGTQYDEDTISAAADKITMCGVVRKDTAATLVDADGDRTQLQVNATGKLWVDTGTVTVTDGAGALNVIIDSSATLTVTDGAGAMNSIIDSGTLTAVTSITNAVDVFGSVAHDADATAVDPLLCGGYSSAAAPTAVSADGEAVRAWYLRNGAQATVLTAAGALIGGDAANGLDVDVTRMAALVTGSAVIGQVSIDQTTPGTTNLVQVTDGSGALNTIIDSGTLTTVTTVTNLTNLPNEGQQTAANSISVTPDTDNDAIAANAAAPPTGRVAIGGLGSGATGGLMTGVTVCDSEVAIDIVTATTTLMITGVSGRHVRICAMHVFSAGAGNVVLINGTGATCGTSTAGMNGGVTAAEGWNFVANQGMTMGSGFGEILSTNNVGGATGDSVCIITSAAVQLSGWLKYAIY